MTTITHARVLRIAAPIVLSNATIPLLGAVDAVTGGFRREDMFRYLKTGMAGITAEECDLLENYVILWSIRGNMWLRDTEWTANPDGYGQEMTPERPV